MTPPGTARAYADPIMPPTPAGPPPADGLLSAARRNLRELAHGLSHASHPPVPLLAGSPHRWLRLLPYAVVLALAAVFIPVASGQSGRSWTTRTSPAGGM